MRNNKHVAELRIHALDKELHKKLRHICFDMGISMSALIKQLIEDFVEKAEKGHAKKG